MKLKLLAAVLFLQTAWILGTVIQQETVLQLGKMVLLETQPVDPRDPLRGDFVQLHYKVSNLARGRFSPPLTNDLAAGTRVYVILTPTGTNGFWDISRASLERIKPRQSEVLLSGRSEPSWLATVGSVNVEYGIEKYFIAEGTGNPRGKLTVAVVVSRSGRGAIKDVFVDGKPYVEAVKNVDR
jgi:uncharacterized membrane-anchored protein